MKKKKQQQQQTKKQNKRKQNKRKISFSPETWDKMYFWPQLFKTWSAIH